MNEIKFINSYSFVFNERPGTPASKLKKINHKIAKERLDIFQNIADDIKKNYRMNLINSKARVLFENKIKNENKYFGRDEYFNSVIVESDRDVTGKILEVKINQCNRNTLFGEVILNKNYRENAA
jgi:tRNA-2-methylthio-N6-dimethylallyladenosine synthase